MKLNLWLVRASQFLQQFRLDVCHKPGKEYIVPDALSRLANANRHPNPQHSKLDALFTYNTTVVEIHPALMSRILAGYKAEPWWVRLQLEIQANSNLGVDAVTLPFVVGSTPPTDSDPYLAPCPNSSKNLPPISLDVEETSEELLIPDKSKLFYHINRVTNVHHLYIPSSVAPDILSVAHKEGYPGFSWCYEIITRS